jgi:UDP-galactopyranose mutase
MRSPTLYVVVPHLPREIRPEEAVVVQQNLLDELFAKYGIQTYVAWYFTPGALAFSGYLEPLAVVYDCMDELSAFQNASPLLKQQETEFLTYADLIFTGGQSLYEAKRYRHPRVYAFPSVVDFNHFIQARNSIDDPVDQEDIRHPRLGFYGVIDERLNTALLAEIADAQPNWNFVLIGPIVKIKPEALPIGDNIHYLGRKSYEELPFYLAGWDVALIPFAHNESTRFISPTKTLEYLAAGKPIVSTSIHDVVYPYGQQGLVTIADTPGEFIAAINRIIKQQVLVPQQKVDEILAQASWDATWKQMSDLIEDVVAERYEWPSYSVTPVISSQPVKFEDSDGNLLV